MTRATRVLVVDDFVDVADSTCMLLALRGFRCRSAVTAREGIEVAIEFDPDVALVDLDLPDISGFELARALRRLRPERPLLLAAVTGWSGPEIHARALAAGFDQHVLKPTSLAKIDQIVRAARHQRALG